MPWPRKKPKSRRMAAEKASSPRRVTQPKETATSRRIGRWVYTGVFYLAVVAILAPSVPPLLRPGDVAPRDYVAEVDFSVQDRPATIHKRVESQKSTLRVFDENADSMRALPGEALRALEQIQVGASVADRVDERFERWLTEEHLSAIASGLSPGLMGELEESLVEFCDAAAARGVIDEKLHRNEIGAYRFQIRVPGRAEDSEDDGVVDLIQEVIVWPEGFRQKLAEHLAKVFDEEDSKAFRSALVELVARLSKPTLDYDDAATREAVYKATHDIEPVTSEFAAGSTLVWYGDVVTPQQAREVRMAYAAARRRNGGAAGPVAGWRRTLGVAGVTALIFLGAAVFLIRRRKDMMRSNTRLVVMGGTVLTVLLCARLLIAWNISLYVTPLVLSAMLLALTCGTPFAIGMSVVATLLLTILFRGHFDISLNFLIGAAVGAIYLARVRRRTQLMEAGLLAGAAQFVAIWSLGQVPWAQSFPTSQRLLTDSFVALASSSALGFVLSGLLPYAERLFGFTTDLSLAEWADRNQPLLRRLAMDAPGTFHHSLMVGTLAEAASEAVDCNPVLARAGGYLHDVGKLWKPEYFIENTQGGESPHDRLSPMMSTLIITSHAKDGADLAEDYGLPKQLRDIIEQHHGTTVLEFFYNEALVEASDAGEINRDNFRYRGPKPSTVEAAIVLLADSVESATRSLSHPTPARIESLVRDISRRRLMDHQLDQAEITFTELNRIEESLTRSLLALFHQRIVYPEAKGLNGRKKAKASAT